MTTKIEPLSNTVNNWIEVLEHQASSRPDQLAFIESDRSISYAALSQRVKTLATELAQHTQFGDRVLIVLPAGIDYVIGFFACIYANVIAVTAYPPNSKKRDWTRLDTIVRDCEPALVLHNVAQQKPVDGWINAGNSHTKTIAVDKLSTADSLEIAKQWRKPAIDGNDIAYFQYSSGSTGNPKGVMLSHLNLLSNTRLIQRSYHFSEQDKFVNWLPLYHDMGFVGGVLTPLLVGASTWLMPSATVAQQPFRLLKLITDIKATVTAGPNFIFDLALSKVTSAEKAELDLSSLRVFINGAEPINARTLTRFSQAFAETGFAPEALKPSYGMAEACLLVTATAEHQCFKLLSLDKDKLSLGKAVMSDDSNAKNLVDMACSGKIMAEVTVKIVHQGSRQLLPDGYVGEIMIKGDCISRGYWQKPDINQTIFNQQVANQGGFMATGDLGFIDNNQLYVSGRCKEMFIINGRNYYPQDIEESLNVFSEQLTPHGGAIFEVATDEHNHELVLVQELSRKTYQHNRQHHKQQGDQHSHYQPLIEQVIAQIAQAHELKLAAVMLIKPLTLAKTSSGKIQRVACREAYLQGQLQTVASWHKPVADDNHHQANYHQANYHQANRRISQFDADSLDQAIGHWIIHWIAQRLNLPATQLKPYQQLAQLGLDSIDAMTLTHELSKQLDVPLSADLCWSYPSIQALAQQLASIATSAQIDQTRSKQAKPPMEGMI
ncbi:MAG: acyl-CoA synthetase (AMP-forming)/AMP-acid ligase II/aryl carrier-like protein [Phenylobacterium sp.]|jgi:acyl-CoA synthetase (AMP-forming)/AMP-acid ligase II/aryl carrier-like protein